jgi:hypothetical protein
MGLCCGPGAEGLPTNERGTGRWRLGSGWVFGELGGAQATDTE